MATESDVSNSKMDPSLMAAMAEQYASMSPAQKEAMQNATKNMDPSMIQRAAEQVKEWLIGSNYSNGSYHNNLFHKLPVPPLPQTSPPPTRPPRSPPQMKNMSPEQVRMAAAQMKSMPPEALSAQAANFSTPTPPSPVMLSRANSLKTEGNQLAAEGRWREARDKYEQASSAVRDLQSPSANPEARALLTACSLNLALCFLKLEEYGPCILECNAILAASPDNIKARGRRGVARLRLGENLVGAREDLENAAIGNPGDDVMMAALAEVKAKLGSGEDGETTKKEIPSTGEGESVEEDAASHRRAAVRSLSTSTSSPVSTSAFSPPVNMAAAAEQMAANPSLVRQQYELLAGMSQTQLDAMLSATGQTLPGGQKLTPEMAKMMAAQLKNMSDDDLKKMVAGQMAAMPGMMGDISTRTGSTTSSKSPSTSTLSPPLASTSNPMSSSPGMAGMPTNLADLLGNKDMVKLAVNAMTTMPNDQLRAMMGATGNNLSDAQIDSMRKTLSGLSDDQLDKVLGVVGFLQKAGALMYRHRMVLIVLAVLLVGMLMLKIFFKMTVANQISALTSPVYSLIYKDDL